jgi:hypothetical protein
LNTRQRGFQQATNKQKGLMFPCGLPLGGCFVFLEMGASIVFFVFPLFMIGGGSSSLSLMGANESLFVYTWGF